MKSISFARTTQQVRDRTKTVTRRLGWATLLPGTVLRAVEKAQGLRKGEKQKPITTILVTSVRREPLNAITAEDVVREGFPRMSVGEFIFMVADHNDCDIDAEVTRIEFAYTVGQAVARLVGHQ